MGDMVVASELIVMRETLRGIEVRLRQHEASVNLVHKSLDSLVSLAVGHEVQVRLGRVEGRIAGIWETLYGEEVPVPARTAVSECSPSSDKPAVVSPTLGVQTSDVPPATASTLRTLRAPEPPAEGHTSSVPTSATDSVVECSTPKSDTLPVIGRTSSAPTVCSSTPPAVNKTEFHDLATPKVGDGKGEVVVPSLEAETAPVAPTSQAGSPGIAEE